MTSTNNSLGIRTKIAGAAAISTVCILSVVGAIGYRAMEDATQQSRVELLEERLDELEDRLRAGDRQLIRSLQVDSGVQVVWAGSEVPPAIPGSLRIVRESPDPEIDSLVGVVDTRRVDATLATIRTALWISVFLIGALVGAIAWIVVDRALSPVRRLTSEAEANMASGTPEMLVAHGASDEIAGLASTFNAMLTKLRQADLDRRRFVSDASHELRTPLMVLSADAEYALEHRSSSADTATDELARSVLDQSDRLTAMVDDLLALASLDEQQHVDADYVSVNHVLAVAEAGALTPDLPEVVGATMVPNISRSVANVIGNARRHQSTRVAVDVSIDHTTQTATFVVDDDGPGIPKHEREQIFKRFYRPAPDRNRRDGGAGLGLAIVRAEVSRLGGTVWVDESPLGGARFVLAVPLCPTD